MNEKIFERPSEFSAESGADKLARLNDILAKELRKKSNAPQDFLFSELKSSKLAGAFSKLHFLGDNFVVKERLSKNKKETLEQVLALKDKLDNNRLLCGRYLGDNIMDGHYIVKDNENGLPAIFFIQQRLPEDCLDLHPDQLDMLVDDEVRARFTTFVDGLKNMFRDFGVIIDLQTLGNIAYSPSKKQFYAFDFDPLISSPECSPELNQKLYLGEPFGKNIKTFTGGSTREEAKVSYENLELLEKILSFEEK